MRLSHPGGEQGSYGASSELNKRPARRPTRWALGCNDLDSRNNYTSEQLLVSFGIYGSLPGKVVLTRGIWKYHFFSLLLLFCIHLNGLPLITFNPIFFYITTHGPPATVAAGGRYHLSCIRYV